MKRSLWMVALLAAVAIPFAACKSSKSGSGDVRNMTMSGSDCCGSCEKNPANCPKGAECCQKQKNVQNATIAPACNANGSCTGKKASECQGKTECTGQRNVQNATIAPGAAKESCHGQTDCTQKAASACPVSGQSSTGARPQG